MNRVALENAVRKRYPGLDTGSPDRFESLVTDLGTVEDAIVAELQGYIGEEPTPEVLARMEAATRAILKEWSGSCLP